MIRTEYNALTNETLEINLTDKEIAQRLKDEAEAEAELASKRAEAEAKAQAKAAAESKLAALGLTTNDLRALGL